MKRGMGIRLSGVAVALLLLSGFVPVVSQAQTLPHPATASAASTAADTGTAASATVLQATPVAESPASVTSTDLLEDPARYDGKIVRYAGEIIGDRMRRQDGTWLNVSDGTNAIGVFVPSAFSVEGLRTGDYQHVGDRVEVTGTFRRACPAHGGDFDLHAVSLAVVTPGAFVPHPLQVGLAIAVLMLWVPAGLLLRALLRKTTRWGRRWAKG